MEVMEKHNKEPEKRIAQKILAEQIITDLHGEESCKQAIKISESLFSGDVKSFSEKDIKDAFNGLEPFTITEDKNIVDVLVDGGVCSSKREAREFITNGSITINGEKVTDVSKNVEKNMCLFDKYLIIRRGKKKYSIGIYK